ncbi:hypothetical protein B0H19DRAFT_1079797 [Mycena capillaripes]|nr:hypothetical protein B0H19DRAFT_1079797 [Mycena capillaripes]
MGLGNFIRALFCLSSPSTSPSDFQGSQAGPSRHSRAGDRCYHVGLNSPVLLRHQKIMCSAVNWVTGTLLAPVIQKRRKERRSLLFAGHAVKGVTTAQTVPRRGAGVKAEGTGANAKILQTKTLYIWGQGGFENPRVTLVELNVQEQANMGNMGLFNFWLGSAFLGSQIKLTEIATNFVTKEIFEYLRSYSGIEKLKCGYSGSRDKFDRLADTFATVLPRHATSVVELSYPAGYESRFGFGTHNVDNQTRVHPELYCRDFDGKIRLDMGLRCSMKGMCLDCGQWVKYPVEEKLKKSYRWYMPHLSKSPNCIHTVDVLLRAWGC